MEQTIDQSNDNPHTPSQQPLLSIDQFEIGRKLSHGKIGHVYLARVRDVNFVVALKVMNKCDIMEQQLEQQLQREISIQARLNHPNILKLYTYFHDDNRVYLVLEFAAQGELCKVIKHVGRFSDRLASRITRQLIDALQYCHERSIIHRDLKSENILLDHWGNIKLSDFGCSIKSETLRGTRCGTPDYLPPEIIAGEQYDHRVDLWCLGVLTYEMLVGRPPFEQRQSEEWLTSFDRDASIDKLTTKIDTVCHFRLPPILSPFAADFISALLRRKPADRMSLHEARRHSWILLYADDSVVRS